MNHMLIVSNGVLWAAAIIASALLGAPPILSTILLPTLAVCALTTLSERRRRCP